MDGQIVANTQILDYKVILHLQAFYNYSPLLHTLTHTRFMSTFGTKLCPRVNNMNTLLGIVLVGLVLMAGAALLIIACVAINGDFSARHRAKASSQSFGCRENGPHI